jgi:hypothetical protein
MRLSLDGNNYNMPDFVIVGAARSATTSMFYYLKAHPDICMSTVKEPHFFSFYKNRPHYQQISGQGMDDFRYANHSYSLPHYSTLFKPNADRQVLGEASTSYLYFYEEVIRNVKQLYGSSASSLKIIILLRNPIDRAWSHYLFQKRSGREELPFREAIKPETIRSRMDSGVSFLWDYLGFGFYYDQVKAFKESFSDVLVVLSENFTRAPKETMTTIMEFLNVDTDVSVQASGAYNVSGKPKNPFYSYISSAIYHPNPLRTYAKQSLPPSILKKLRYLKHWLPGVLLSKETMGAEERHYLIGIYRSEIARLSSMLGFSLDHWLDADAR